MPQPKISSFFQPSQQPHPFQKEIEHWDLLSGVFDPNPPVELGLKDNILHPKSGFLPISISDEFSPSKRYFENKKIGISSKGSRNFSKKRRCEQYHLDLGQSDFMLCACSLCGLMYARGVEEDERVHRKFHQDFERGIRFKGWQNERVVDGPWINGDRILLVLDTDSSAQKRLVQKVVKAAKKELGFVDDNILHALCKVYLFISAHRVVGWLVAEPIRTAHRVIPTSFFGNKSTEISTIDKMDLTDTKKSKETTLQFGDFRFCREPVKNSCPTTSTTLEKWDSGAIICEENALSAKCGIMAIWVVPSSRRKTIATQLLDAVRKSFFAGEVLEISECAFSPPTSAGVAFASSYTNCRSFLVYRADDV